MSERRLDFAYETYAILGQLTEKSTRTFSLRFMKLDYHGAEQLIAHGMVGLGWVNIAFSFL